MVPARIDALLEMQKKIKSKIAAAVFLNFEK